jgi:hypothetical protein
VIHILIWTSNCIWIFNCITNCTFLERASHITRNWKFVAWNVILLKLTYASGKVKHGNCELFIVYNGQWHNNVYECFSSHVYRSEYPCEMGLCVCIWIWQSRSRFHLSENLYFIYECVEISFFLSFFLQDFNFCIKGIDTITKFAFSFKYPY